MNAVVPVVVVISRRAIPAAVMILERVMRPAITGVGPTHNDSLPRETLRPDLRRVDVVNTCLDGLRRIRCFDVFN